MASWNVFHFKGGWNFFCATALREKEGHAACPPLLFQFYFLPSPEPYLSVSVSFLLEFLISSSAEILLGQVALGTGGFPVAWWSSSRTCFCLSSERIQPLTATWFTQSICSDVSDGGGRTQSTSNSMSHFLCRSQAFKVLECFEL